MNVGRICGIQSIYEDLEANGVRVVLDDREDKTPGYKFNHWVRLGFVGSSDFWLN